MLQAEGSSTKSISSGILLGRAEVVGVILGEAPHPHQPVHHAAALVAVDGPLFSIAHGQISVRADIRFIDLDVEGAVHRLEVILLVSQSRWAHTYSPHRNQDARSSSTSRLCRCGAYKRTHTRG
jgi:hypothetical protein